MESQREILQVLLLLLCLCWYFRVWNKEYLLLHLVLFYIRSITDALVLQIVKTLCIFHVKHTTEVLGACRIHIR